MDPTPSPDRDGRPARRLAWLLVGVLVGLSLLIGLPRGVPAPPAGPTAVPAAAPVADGGPEARSPATPTAPDLAEALAPPQARPMSRAARAIERGEDLHALASALLATAEGGEPEAQYGLARIVEVCAYELARFADAAALSARRDELLSRAVGIHGPAAVALDEERFRMCDGFRRDPLARFGDPLEWLQRAADSSHPLASATLASELERSAVPPGSEPLDDAARVARQRELFLVALRSARPEALWAGFLFDAGESGLIDQWAPAPEGVAWLLLACARGYECSRAARWRRELEAFGGLPPYEDWAEALLFELPPWQREAALARARELAAALDAVLGNVHTHTPPGTPYDVALVVRGGRAVLTVGDHGPGIDDPAAALDRGRSGAGSSGLGLDIAARTAEAAGGTLRLDPSRRGTTVVLDLPLAGSVVPGSGLA